MIQRMMSGVITLLILSLAATAYGTPAPTSEPSDEIGGLTSAHTLTLSCGKSAILSVPRPFKTIDVASPATACVNFIHGSPRLILVTGRSPGVTNIIIVTDERVLTPVDVVVTPAQTAAQASAHRDDTLPRAIPEDSKWFSPRVFWLATASLPMVCLIVCLEPLIRRGKIRMLVLTWIWSWFAIGQICFAWGMAAVGHGEPIKQVGPMLLASACVWMAMLFASRRMNRRYRDVELKRMQLMDIV